MYNGGQYFGQMPQQRSSPFSAYGGGPPVIPGFMPVMAPPAAVHPLFASAPRRSEDEIFIPSPLDGSDTLDLSDREEVEDSEEEKEEEIKMPEPVPAKPPPPKHESKAFKSIIKNFTRPHKEEPSSSRPQWPLAQIQAKVRRTESEAGPAKPERPTMHKKYDTEPAMSHTRPGPVVPSQIRPVRVYRYRPAKNCWKHLQTFGLTGSDTSGASSPTSGVLYEREDPFKPPTSSIRVITWNVDKDSPLPEERLTAALRHIQRDVLGCRDDDVTPEACCILLQEMHERVLEHLKKDEWVRRWFALTPLDKDKWPKPAEYPGYPPMDQYGNVTLISRSLPIVEAHIVSYGSSVMCRTALCVKIRLTLPPSVLARSKSVSSKTSGSSGSSFGSSDTAVLSIVNTHLESLPVGEQSRPHQLEVCSRLVRTAGVRGGIIAGDMNAISQSDATIHKDLQLRDAWDKAESRSAHTWGFQGNNPSNVFPCNRLDKIFYVPKRGYTLDTPRRIGVDLKINRGTKQELWVSDHCGLQTTLRMLSKEDALNDMN